MCCAPCSCFPVEKLRCEGFSITGLWYNPNIHGYMEYKKRLMTLGYYITKEGKFDIIESGYDVKKWFHGTGSTEYGDSRCFVCYRLRLMEAARISSETGIGAFTTTLLYSRYQDHEGVRTAGEEAAKEFSVDFLYRDFREGWKKGVEMSKSLKLYRQQYCGCIFSEKERFDVS